MLLMLECAHLVATGHSSPQRASNRDIEAAADRHGHHRVAGDGCRAGAGTTVAAVPCLRSTCEGPARQLRPCKHQVQAAGGRRQAAAAPCTLEGIPAAQPYASHCLELEAQPALRRQRPQPCAQCLCGDCRGSCSGERKPRRKGVQHLAEWSREPDAAHAAPLFSKTAQRAWHAASIIPQQPASPSLPAHG